MGTGSFPGVKSGRGVTLTPYPLLVPWSWKSRAISLLPLWAVRPVQSLSACTRVHFTLHYSCVGIGNVVDKHPHIYIYIYIFFFSLWRCDPTRVMASSFLRFLDQTQRRTTVGRAPLDEWSARRRDHYLTTHNTHNRQISMPPVGFEPTISAIYIYIYIYILIFTLFILWIIMQ